MPPRPAAKTGGTLSAKAKQEGRGAAGRRAKPARNRALKKKPEPKVGPKAGHKGPRHRSGHGGPRRERKRRGRGTTSSLPAAPDGADATQSNVCPICQETYCPVKFPVVHAPCGHVACASCSLTWQRKKSTRTCALCRTPVLSVAHCQQLEQFLVRSGPQEMEVQEGAPGASSSSSAAGPVDVEANRVEVKKGLQELSQGDLNFIPGDYRAHLVRASAHRAVRKGDLTMLENCLRDFKVRASTRLVCEIAGLWKKEPRPVLSLLLAHGARMDGHPENRPLLHAVYSGNTRMVEALLEVKASPTKTSDGESPLHVAVRRGRQEAVRLLVAHGANAYEPDPSGRTPKFLAELGWRMHEMSCPGGQCQRCVERRAVRGMLAAFRGDAEAAPGEPEAAAAQAPAEQQAVPEPTAALAVQPPSGQGEGQAAQAEEQEEPESEDSSSDWEESCSDVSDMDDWASDDEDDQEGEEEEGDDEDDQSDDDDDSEENFEVWEVNG